MLRHPSLKHSFLRRQCLGIWVALWFCTGSSWAATESAEKVYFRALTHFKEKKWAVAEKLFQRTFFLLGKKKATNLRGRHLLLLGRCDILYHLAYIAQMNKARRRACRFYDALHKKLTKQLSSNRTGYFTCTNSN